MADQNRAVKTQPDQKNGSKTERVQPVRPSGESILAEVPAGPVAAGGSSSIDAQTTRLGSPDFRTAQRQAIAAQIGRAQGNNHLQRVIAPLVKEEPAPEGKPGPYQSNNDQTIETGRVRLNGNGHSPAGGTNGQNGNGHGNGSTKTGQIHPGRVQARREIADEAVSAEEAQEGLGVSGQPSLAGAPPPEPNGSSSRAKLVQRQEADDEQAGPTEAEKAAALAKAKAARASAMQAASEGRSEVAKSKEKKAAEQQAKEQSQQKADQSKAESAAQAGAKGPAKAGAAPEKNGKSEAAPGSTPAVGGNGAKPAAGAYEKAPTSSRADPAFQAAVQNIKGVAQDKKTHAPAETEAAEAQAAAEPAPGEVESKAQANQVGDMQQAPTPGFNAAAFKAQLMQRIQELAPTNAEEADDFKEDNKLGEVKDEAKGKAAEEEQASKAPMEQAAAKPPDTSAIEPKPVTPMEPPQPGSPPPAVGAEGAVPKPKTSAELETPLKENTQQINQQMADVQITDQHLEKSKEPEFEEALAAKNEANTQAQAGPQEYRQFEQGQTDQAQVQAAAVAAERTQAMHTGRAALLGQVSGQQTQAKSKDEQERAKISAEIQRIYGETKTKVEEILKTLDDKVGKAFDEGSAAAKLAFEEYVDARMEAYKEERYGGWLGWAKWLDDKLFSMPSEVNVFYTEGRNLFLSKMDAVIDNVVTIIGAGLAEAKAEIANGKKRIQEYLTTLPESQRKMGQDAAADIQGKFDELTESVDAKQNELVDNLANKYQEQLQAVDARIEELKAANQGLVDKAINAVAGVIKTILKLKDMLMTVLAKVADVVMKIIEDPIGFLGNLISGITKGFDLFVGNIMTHLQAGLIGWLTGTLGGVGLQLPNDPFSLEGIFSIVMQILGLSWDYIRGKAVKLLGEPVVKALETGFEVFQILISQGPAGLWEYIKDSFSDLKEMVMDAIKDMIITEVIKAGVKWILGLLSPAGAFIKAAMAIYDIVMFFIQRGSQIVELVNAIVDSVAAIASGAIDNAAKMVENALAKAVPVVIGFLASLLGIGDLAKKVQTIINKVRGKIDKAIEGLIMKAKVAGKKLLGKIGVGKEKKLTAEEAENAKNGQFTEEDRKIGLAAFTKEEKPFLDNGKISEADAKVVASTVTKKHPVFQSITVVDGKDSWNYQYVFRKDDVDTPSVKKEGGKVNVEPIRDLFTDKETLAFLDQINGKEYLQAAQMLRNVGRRIEPKELTNESILDAIKASFKGDQLVDVSSIRDYRPGWSDEIKEELAAIYPEYHMSGTIRILYEKALSKKGKLYNRAIFNRNHMTAYSTIKNDLLNRLHGVSFQDAAKTIQEESNRNVTPQGETNASFLEAIKQLLRYKFNDVANVYLGDARENQLNGSQLPAALEAMEQAAASGDSAAFEQAKANYLALGFDPEPIDFFYDKFKSVRERL